MNQVSLNSSICSFLADTAVISAQVRTSKSRPRHESNPLMYPSAIMALGEALAKACGK
jgi:hypothetical protein